MLKLPSWRTAWSSPVCLFGVLSLLPNFLLAGHARQPAGLSAQPAITLGLDLQGGSYLLLEVDVAPVYRSGWRRMVGDVRAAPARRPHQLSRARRAGRHRHPDADRSGAARSGAGRDREAEPHLARAGRPDSRFRHRREGGRIVLRLTDAKRDRAAPGGDHPVARGRAPPDRRAGHARGLDPASGRRPHPGPGAGREGSGEHQAPARPDGAADLPYGRSRTPASRTRSGARAPRLHAARIGRARRRRAGTTWSSARSSSAART